MPPGPDDPLPPGVLERVLELRRHVHRHPELSHEEYETAELVESVLGELDVPTFRPTSAAAVVGIVAGETEGPTIALRSDLDALPLTERSALAFSSERRAVMHACGHDAHVAMMLGAAMTMVARRKHLAGRVALVFQPAEEAAPVGGAKAIVESDGYRRLDPDLVFALHVWPALDVGEVAVVQGPVSAYSDRFRVIFEGRGGHASEPHMAADPVLPAASFVMQVHSIVGNEVSPHAPAVVRVGRLEAGTSPNVVAEQAVLEGTVRSIDPNVRSRIRKRLDDMAAGAAAAFGVEHTFEYQEGYPMTVNAEPATTAMRRSAEQAGIDLIHSLDPPLIGEDFAWFASDRPAALGLLGARSGAGTNRLHDSGFVLNEAALAYGVRLLAGLPASVAFDPASAANGDDA